VNPLLDIDPAVSDALASSGAVVALETTVVTHGMPPAEGAAMALALEQAVREEAAVPATIGVLEGRVRVGMSAGEIERLAEQAGRGGVVKLNPGNLAAVLASGRSGSTTVAATVMLAAEAGIRVLATGGIGGVHRDVAASGDVSADLVALARHRAAVVCAGAKAVLDLPRTLELLETLGVPVLGYGTDHFPAFYRRSSNLPVDARCDSIEDLAAAVQTHWALASTGVVVAHPVPAEAELPEARYGDALDRALAEADHGGVRGRALTPFLLERLRELTGGATLAANRALLLANARVGGRLAARLAPHPATA
jgi:pseudouridine-5'-phosphate glycosidase